MVCVPILIRFSALHLTSHFLQNFHQLLESHFHADTKKFVGQDGKGWMTTNRFMGLVSDLRHTHLIRPQATFIQSISNIHMTTFSSPSLGAARLTTPCTFSIMPGTGARRMEASKWRGGRWSRWMPSSTPGTKPHPIRPTLASCSLSLIRAFQGSWSRSSASVPPGA